MSRDLLWRDVGPRPQDDVESYDMTLIQLKRLSRRLLLAGDELPEAGLARMSPHSVAAVMAAAHAPLPAANIELVFED